MTKLINVQDVEASEHFEKPDLDWLKLVVQPLCHVKVSNGRERFWCKVRVIEDDIIMATVANELLHPPFKWLDPIMFSYENIYDVAPEGFETENYTEADNIYPIHATCNKLLGEKKINESDLN